MRIKTDVIKFELNKRFITQGEFAELAGISRATLSTSLTRGSCRADTLSKIANALNIDSSDLISKKQEEEMSDTTIELFGDMRQELEMARYTLYKQSLMLNKVFRFLESRGIDLSEVDKFEEDET